VLVVLTRGPTPLMAEGRWVALVRETPGSMSIKHVIRMVDQAKYQATVSASVQMPQ
jgi:hypothetical protein